MSKWLVIETFFFFFTKIEQFLKILSLQIVDKLGYFRLHVREDTGYGTETSDAEGHAFEQEGINWTRKYHTYNDAI